MRLKSALNNKGFTLLELIIVMAIIGLLAAGVLLTPGILDNRNKAVDTSNLDAASKIQQQIYAYFITTGIRFKAEDATNSVILLNVDELKTAKIISTDADITGSFYFTYSAEGTPNVGFTLTSTQNRPNSTCFKTSVSNSDKQICSTDNYFFVPASGRLGSNPFTK